MISHTHMARVYIAQARATPHRSWRTTLLDWAGARRRRALKEIQSLSRHPVQQPLF